MSRVKFHLVDLPKPDLQYDVYNEVGDWIGRTDFWWPEFNTVGEFDGRIKYGRTLQPEQPVEDVLFDEKRREDAIRDQRQADGALDLGRSLPAAGSEGETRTRLRPWSSRRAEVGR